MQRDIHQVQVSVLRLLRRNHSARFSTLMQPTGLTSDDFKFHVRSLMRKKLVDKTAAGDYVLTIAGKEFANNLDEPARRTQKQPKLSVIVVAARTNAADQTEYVMQQRLRQPYMQYWGCISGPVRWGESFEDAASRELGKQTGLTATMHVVSFLRSRDYEDRAGLLLEDKLFTVVHATLDGADDTLCNEWQAGLNRWMSVEELKRQARYFSASVSAIELVSKHLTGGAVKSEAFNVYSAEDTRYAASEY